MDKKNLIIKLFKSLRGEKDFMINKLSVRGKGKIFFNNNVSEAKCKATNNHFLLMLNLIFRYVLTNLYSLNFWFH